MPIADNQYSFRSKIPISFSTIKACVRLWFFWDKWFWVGYLYTFVLQAGRFCYLQCSSEHSVPTVKKWTNKRRLDTVWRSTVSIHNVLLPWWHFLPTGFFSSALSSAPDHCTAKNTLLVSKDRMRFSFHFCCKDLCSLVFWK